MINIFTVLKLNQGWSSMYVEKFYQSLKRNTTVNFNFYCITDAKIDNINTIPLINLIDGAPGYWHKIQLFKESINIPSFYFDLDTIIKDNLDQIIFDLKNEKFVMVRSPFKKPYHSSCIMYWNGDYKFIWDRYLKDKEKFNSLYARKIDQNYGDQLYISDTVKEYNILQDIISNPKSIGRIRKKVSSDFEKILICSGNRAPWKCLDHPDVIKYWS